MPPEGHPLKPEQIAKLKAWIEQGAKVPADDAQEPDPRDHWAFRTPARPPLPKHRNTKHRTPNPIDAFIAAKWAEKGLTPVKPGRQARAAAPRLPRPHRPAADRRADRRLPQGHVAGRLREGRRSAARRRRSTASAGAGTGWTSGATATGGASGAEVRNSQKHIWHWRDWIVESLNADKGYDQMVREMLAADELYPDDRDKLRAHRLPGPAVLPLQPHHLAGRSRRAHRKGVPRPDVQLLPSATTTSTTRSRSPTTTASARSSSRTRSGPTWSRASPTSRRTASRASSTATSTRRRPFHIRGDERNPDKDRVVTPGLPQFLAPGGADDRAR